jgi:hypothetical protein
MAHRNFERRQNGNPMGIFQWREAKPPTPIETMESTKMLKINVKTEKLLPLPTVHQNPPKHRKGNSLKIF